MQGNESTVLGMSTIWSHLETMQDLLHKTSGCFCKLKSQNTKKSVTEIDGVNSNQDMSQSWNSPSTLLSTGQNFISF